jgi:hypothetical protein
MTEQENLKPKNQNVGPLVISLFSSRLFFFFFGVYSKNLGRPSAPLGTTRGPAR